MSIGWLLASARQELESIMAPEQTFAALSFEQRMIGATRRLRSETPAMGTSSPRASSVLRFFTMPGMTPVFVAVRTSLPAATMNRPR